MSDEESQTVAVPAPKAIEEENTTTTPQMETQTTSNSLMSISCSE